MPPRQRGSFASAMSFLLSLALLPSVLSQIIPNTLPSCAQSCTVLQQAQTSCESNPSSAGTCLCSSTLITGLKNSGSNICSPECSASDYTTIANWYNEFCANGGTNPTTTLQVVTITSPAPNSPTTAAAPAATTTAPSVSSSNSDVINQNQTGAEWWSTHWQWILMLIILVIAFTAIGFGARFFYRRHQRKKDGVEGNSGSSRAPDMGMWVPSRHSVHDFAGPSNQAGSSNHAGSSNAAAAAAPGRHPSGKGKGKGRADESMGPLRASSKRLRKAANAMQM